MGTISRVHTWTTNESPLKSADLNAEFDNLLTTANGHIDASNLDLTISPTWTGTHVYSNTITGAARAALGAGFYNLGLTFSAGVLTVTDRAAATLSPSNPGWVVAPSITAGGHVLLKLTAAQSIQDAGGSSQILGRWGTTASIAWGSAMPLYLYLVNIDDTAANARFALARLPHYRTTPASTNNIGIAGTAPASSSQSNMVLFGTGANTNYNSKPCILLGSVRATCDNSVGGVYTITALSAGRDGFGGYQWGQLFTFPTNQQGAAAGSYFTANAGTAPTFTADNLYQYIIDPDGNLDCYIALSNAAGGTAGSGAVTAQLTIPFIPTNPLTTATVQTAVGSCHVVGSTIATVANFLLQQTAQTYVNIVYQSTIVTATTALQNAGLAAAARGVAGTLRFMPA